jgi:TRAP transporter TAXI family solute receptor
MKTRQSIAGERHSWSWARTAGFALIAIVLLFSLVILKPAAPDRIVLLTGPEGGSYLEIGARLAESISGSGLEVEVRATAGGLENIETLCAGAENTVALAPSTVEQALGPDTVECHLVSLGSIGFEPSWVFVRSEVGAAAISDLAGKRLATGPPGTVIRELAETLLKTNGIADRVDIVDPEDSTPASTAAALIANEVDAAFFAGTPAAPVITELLAHPDIDTMSVDRADAYEAWYPGVAKIEVPEGIADLERNLPRSDIELLAMTTNLVTTKGLHSEVVPLILQSVTDSVDRHRFTTSTTAFPNAEHTSLPVDLTARRYFDQGRSGLGEFLPTRADPGTDYPPVATSSRQRTHFSSGDSSRVTGSDTWSRAEVTPSSSTR